MRLTAAVNDLAIRLGVNSVGDRGGIKLPQTGGTKRSLDTEAWMAFTATRTITTWACDFDWQANAGPFGMISAGDALDHRVAESRGTAIGQKGKASSCACWRSCGECCLRAA